MEILRDYGFFQRLVLSSSSTVLSLFSMSVSLSSISLSIFPSSSSRGPIYGPGLRGEGRGSLGLGRSGSGRFGCSKGVGTGYSFLCFQGFLQLIMLFRVWLARNHRVRNCFSEQNGVIRCVF